MKKSRRGSMPVNCSKKHLVILYIVCFLLNQPGAVRAINGSTVDLTALAGNWQGEGKIIVGWCARKQLVFDLQIDAAGVVSGTIGDARIRQGGIRLNNIIYRWLGNREYIVEAELAGFLIAKEKIKREAIRIFLDFENPHLAGGFHTSGARFGGREKMIVSGIDVKLTRSKWLKRAKD